MNNSVFKSWVWYKFANQSLTHRRKRPLLRRKDRRRMAKVVLHQRALEKKWMRQLTVWLQVSNLYVFPSAALPSHSRNPASIKPPKLKTPVVPVVTPHWSTATILILSVVGWKSRVQRALLVVPTVSPSPAGIFVLSNVG